ncbi:CLUMA_CG009282, isoform A [Clunio marinus]|uniref:CLUMA_CG009282, isoform A n=1 Tax=Clunio marinus TaxID=568069 RepID=A0A1J1I683_9DIPT|nr:CLUMA_CG009282, isoform A [Clunio marinus]
MELKLVLFSFFSDSCDITSDHPSTSLVILTTAITWGCSMKDVERKQKYLNDLFIVYNLS